MDTTETYIKMCEKATEIQPNIRPVLPEEYGIHHDYHDVWFLQTYMSPKHHVKIIWLPRQDQLQEMYREFKGWNGNHNLIYHLNLTPSLRPIHDEWDSFEKLWLATLMGHKYNKIWNGEDWVAG